MSRRALGIVAVVIGLVVAFLVPYQLDEFWVGLGVSCMAAAIAAIGLTLLVGITGQLSLAHAFFIAVGAYGYCYLSGDTDPQLASEPAGLGLPTGVAMLGAVALSGLAGALFSPISGRLRGIYLGLASIGLVFVGQHILFNASGVTGGFNGRGAAPFNLAGFSFSDEKPDDFNVLGVPFEQQERLWFLGLALLFVAWWVGRNLVKSRPGRAMQQVRDSEVAAAVMGINVPGYKAAAFTVSSMYAGLGGVLFALTSGVIVPETFGFLFSIDFLIMIVIGGLGSIGGAIAGAAVVTALPLVFDEYADKLPLVAAPGGEGLQSGQAARILYGAAVVAVLIYAPQGLAGLSRRLAGRRRATPSEARTITPKESTA